MRRPRPALLRLAVLAAVVPATGCGADGGPAEPTVPSALAISLEKVAGDGQNAPEGSVLPVRPTVQVRDATGEVINDATVSFRVREGGGSVQPAIAVAESGRASTEWTLGAAGHQALVAETGIASVEFTATSFVAGDPDFLAITTRQLNAAYPSFAHADTLQATGGRAPYTWGLAGGELPQGLTLTPDGVIRGRPESEGGSSFTVRVVDGGGIEASGAFELEVCGTPLELEVGEVHIAAPAPPGGCGFSVRAESAGTYYRVTLVGTSPGFELVEPVHFRLRGEVPEGTVAAQSPSVGSPARLGSAVQLSTPAQGAPEDPHLAVRRNEARLLAGLADRGRIRALPDLGAGAASAPADPPPETWEFRLGSPGTVTDNCTVATRTTTVLQGYNDHLALYADTVPFAVLAPQNIPILLSHYERYGAEVIESWGGVADIDGNGRIIVYLDKNLPDPLTGLVWVGDMLPASVCAASNEAELIRIDQSWLPQIPSVLASTLVHEAQHVSSVYKRLLNTLDEPFDGGAQHPPWIEEGRAVMAAETASRLAWAELGGPGPHEQVTAAHLAHLSTDQLGLSGIFTALDRIKRVLREDANSLTHFPDPYGSGWHFHRFLGDWYGDAGRGRLGDAPFMRRLVATETSAGVAGIEEVTGRSFAELMLEYATAISLAGTGAPRLAGVPRFSTYDFTGLEYICCLEEPGRYPWPVTTSGEGPDAPLWVPLGESRTMEREIRANGVQIYDLRASARGEGAIVEVGAPDHVSIVVVRIPDLSLPGR